jgi:hypothetical protein
VRTARRPLQERYATDPKAVEQLRLLYRAQPANVLRALMRENWGPAIQRDMARSIYEQRIPANTKLADIQASEAHPPGHEASAVYRRPDGRIERGEFESGGMTPEQKAMPFREGTNLSHTEPKALGRFKPERGGVLTIVGQYDPCEACQAAMIEASSSGALIVYRWPGGRFMALNGQPHIDLTEP